MMRITHSKKIRKKKIERQRSIQRTLLVEDVFSSPKDNHKAYMALISVCFSPSMKLCNVRFRRERNETAESSLSEDGSNREVQKKRLQKNVFVQSLTDKITSVKHWKAGNEISTLEHVKLKNSGCTCSEKRPVRTKIRKKKSRMSKEGFINERRWEPAGHIVLETDQNERFLKYNQRLLAEIWRMVNYARTSEGINKGSI